MKTNFVFCFLVIGFFLPLMGCISQGKDVNEGEIINSHIEEKGMNMDFEEVKGVWSGFLNAGGQNLQIIIELKEEGQEFQALLSVPAQGVQDFVFDSAEYTESRLLLHSSVLLAEFTAVLKDQSLKGIWKQSNQEFELNLLPAENTSRQLIRPQTPVGPFPYKEERISILNTQAEFSIGATLTLPPGEGPFPGIVLITGSGQQNRDEELFGHRPFAVIADYLTRRGIAVIRYDDRGIGESGGDPSQATSEDFAEDAAVVFTYITERDDIQTTKVGLLGHSEGAIIAAILQEKGYDPAFCVYLGGPGVSGSELLLAQSERIMRASGASESQISAIAGINSEIYELVVKFDGNFDLVSGEIRTKLEDLGLRDEALEAQMGALKSPWFAYFLNYNPRALHQRTKVPTLALLGERDVQVPSELNAPALAADLAGGSSQNRVIIFPQLNHLFQHAETGLVNEYGIIEETISPEVLETIGDWILQIN